MFPQKIADLITQSQATLKEGFHLYTHKGEGTSYFYYVLPSKKILFISKAYQKAKSAKQALNRLYERELSIAYQSLTDKNKNKQYFIQVLDGNQKPFAISYGFNKLKDAKLAFNGLKEWLTIYQKGTEHKPETPKTQEQPPEPPARHSFRIDFYQDQKEQAVRGQIEYLLTREKQSFNGLAEETIQQFIQKFVRKEQEIQNEKATAPVNSSKPPPVTSEESLALAFWEAGQPTSSFNFEIGTPFEVSFGWQEAKNNPAEVIIYLKSLETQYKQLVGHQKLADQCNEQRIPINTQNLAPGFYQLIATMQHQQETGNRAGQLYQQSNIIQLY